MTFFISQVYLEGHSDAVRSQFVCHGTKNNGWVTVRAGRLSHDQHECFHVTPGQEGRHAKIAPAITKSPSVVVPCTMGQTRVSSSSTPVGTTPTPKNAAANTDRAMSPSTPSIITVDPSSSSGESDDGYIKSESQKGCDDVKILDEKNCSDVDIEVITSDRKRNIKQLTDFVVATHSRKNGSPAEEVSDENDESEQEEEYGRGKRKIKQVTVTIQGFQVKKANTYAVKGERYVYDTALHVAHSRPSPTNLPVKKKGSVIRSRVVNQTSKFLQDRNAQVLAQKAVTDARRDPFLRRHLEALRPFVSDRVAVRIMHAADQPMHLQGKSSPSPGAEREEGARAEEGAPVLSRQPASIVGTRLREYQLKGLNFLIDRHYHGVPMILGDEMGLGKTLQTLAFLAYLRIEQGIKGAALVVCPLSVISSWMQEARRWCPQLRVVQLHTSNIEERKRQCKEMLPREDYDVCVTTYDMVKNPVCRHALIHSIHWSTLVLDEGHMLKSEMTGISQAVRKIHRGSTLLLTGTPLQNNLHELWALLNFLVPDVFDEDSRNIFDGSFDWMHQAVDEGRLRKAHTLLKVFMLRRLKVEAEKGLPPRVETKVYCPLSDMQLFYYKLLLLKDADVVARLDATTQQKETTHRATNSTDWKRLQMLMMQLRKASSHPFLFRGAEGDTEASIDELVEASGKLQTLDRLLVKLHRNGHRCVIFSQWRHVLDILDDFLRGRGYRYTRLDGHTNRIRRIINIDAFNAPDSPLFAFLMTTRAGGLGVNLQTADTVILFDSDWNPQPDLQAMARVHRIGQMKVVHVYRLVSYGTIEERVLEHAEKKLYLAEHVNRDSLAGKLGAASRSARGMEEKDGCQEHGDSLPDDLDASSIIGHLTFGGDAVANLVGNQLLDDESMDALIDRSRGLVGSRDEDILDAGGPPLRKTGNVQITSAKKDAATFDATKELTSTRVLQGVTYDEISRPITSLRDISAEWATQKEKRNRLQRITMVDGQASGYGSFVPILKENFYDLAEGESSVFNRELKGKGSAVAFQDKKRFVLTAGRDYFHDDQCANCWDGGEIVTCSHCPSAYHFACLGMGKSKDLPAHWICPQHRCGDCDRNASAAGGVIFRCIACPSSFCYDHKPEQASIVAHNPRFEALGYPEAQHTAFVLCSADCAEYNESYIKSLPAPEESINPMESMDTKQEGDVKAKELSRKRKVKQ